MQHANGNLAPALVLASVRGSAGFGIVWASVEEEMSTNAVEVCPLTNTIGAFIYLFMVKLKAPKQPPASTKDKSEENKLG